ncbi:alkaline phosphatase synthesis sensor protein PhoR [Clostridium ragsdalei P11]|uniref:histidine kinase n=1 Tax=Clostridium ragsdalei P11 TaxID=1353534 RepID=A0A1A6B035_9CLOT|nr:ATP-binding protein [Clostridium ragsdalei]OBR95701.1 alkaline phosphatase synthesis sensor protein PhoR [Clostridium ragsdalei P11]
MQSIRKRLSLVLVLCTIVTVVLSTFFVNHAVDNTFNKYIASNQIKRNQRIVDYFQQIYKRDKRWTKNSGVEMQHEGYMSNYCLTLFDENKREVWGMNPDELKNMPMFSKQDANSAGEYKTNTFSIKYDNKVVGYISIGQYQPVFLSEQDIDFKSSINRNMVVSVLIAICISIFLSILFSKQLSYPIKKVSEASVRLSRGDYEAKLKFNSSVLEIKNLINSIDILREKLKYQDDIRKRLVSDISHELRTPLNILQNNLEAMIDGIFPATTDRLNALNDEVIRFGGLIDNLNILKEFESKEVILNFEKIPLDELMYNICEEIKSHAKSKGIDLIFNAAVGEKYLISGDTDKLKQVFINILSNSVKFTLPGGKIYVNLSFDRQYVIVSIKDSGIGIKKEDLPFIFERLYRGDKSRNEVEGSGIGLTIVKDILILHSAIIDVKSEEGKGTCFILNFNRVK